MYDKCLRLAIYFVLPVVALGFVVFVALVTAFPGWAQQPQADLDQAAAAQFQALWTQLGNTSEAVQKVIDSHKKLQQELDALKQPKVSEAPK